MRGRRAVKILPTTKTRTTPACAGTTRAPPRRRAPRTDNPRVCGDDCIGDPAAAQPRGQPPRVRGRLPGAPLRARAVGTTPACAGTTCGRTPRRPGRADNPRVCGDDPRLLPSAAAGGGQPPRVRGRLRGPHLGRQVQGTTPACAGTTGRHPHRAAGPGDNPRVCGDDSRSATPSGAARGQPPRVRGRLTFEAVVRDDPRTTPACAGTTLRPG